MSDAPQISDTDQTLREMREELDNLIIGIELTLISIIQGIALGVLAGAAIDPLIQLHFEYWPYILTGLALILLFWSRAILHTLSFIGWPINLLHNFSYFAATLIQVGALTQITQPTAWFGMTTAYSVSTLLVYTIDYYIVRQRMRTFRGQAAHRLYEDIIHDQLFNMRIMMPSSIVFHGIAWYALAFYPEIFIQQHWHLLFSITQVMVSLALLYSEFRHMRKRTHLILIRRVEERLHRKPAE